MNKSNFNKINIAKNFKVLYNVNIIYADVAELADALDLGSSAIGVGVRLPSSAPRKNTTD